MMASSALIIAAHFLSIPSFVKNYGSWQLHLIGRLLHGIGMGLLSCTLFIYSAELTTGQNRVREVWLWQL